MLMPILSGAASFDSRRCGSKPGRQCGNRFVNEIKCSLGCARSDLDRLLRAMEIEPTNMTKPRADHDIGGIARKTRSRDAILHDVEGVDHHG